MTFAASSIGLSFLLNVSLNVVWGFINAQQPIIHAPFFKKLRFPTNVLLINSFITEIATFEIIKTGDWLDPLIFSLPDKGPAQANFEAGGYDSHFAIENISVIHWLCLIQLPLFMMLKLLAIACCCQKC